MRLRDRRIQTSYPVRLTCQAIGFPLPDITWYRNSEIITRSGELHQESRNINEKLRLKIEKKIDLHL